MTIEERDAQVIEAMRRRALLTQGGYLLLRGLRRLGLDAYAYWSGGERTGTPCVWAFDKRYAVEEWNALTVEGAARLMAAVRTGGGDRRGGQGAELLDVDPGAGTEGANGAGGAPC